MAQNENELQFDDQGNLVENGGNNPNPVKQLRDELDRLKEKHKGDLDKARTEAKDAALKEVERKGQATEVGTKLGFPKAASLFLSSKPDLEPTEENLRSFFTDELGLEVKQAEGEQKVEGEQPKQETPQQIGTGNVAGFHQGGGAPTGQKRYTGGEAVDAYNRGELTLEEFNRAIDDGNITKADPGYVVHKQPG